MRKNYKLRAEETVLVIIDFQEKLMKVMDQREKVYKNTKLLTSLAAQLDIPVIVTEQYPSGLGPTAPEIMTGLNNYLYMDKMEFSAIEGLRRILAPLNRKTVLVTGSETHVCVFQTVRDLVEDGYNVHLVKDAVCSRFEENYRSGLDLMHGAGAIISNSETVLFDLMRVAGSPVFKVISPLLK